MGGAANPSARSGTPGALRTDAGDIVLALYPDGAPKTVKQILALAKLGVFNTVHIARIEPGFVVQLGSAADRAVALSSEQQAAITKIPLETSALRHQQGVVSMAHGDDPNDAESSFSILLSDAPHLDGKYTVFGRVESGFDVVQEIAKLPVDATTHRPLLPFLIGQGLAIDAAELGKYQIRSGAIHLVHPEPAKSATPTPAVILSFLAIIAALGLATFMLAGKLSPRALGSMGLLVVMVCFFSRSRFCRRWLRRRAGWRSGCLWARSASSAS